MNESSNSGRTFKVDGLANARDLGGLYRRNGEPTPTGVFYRSENVDWITPAGWDQVAAAGIRTVVDLRSQADRASDTSPRPSFITTAEVDLDGLENSEFWKDYRENGLIGTALYFGPHLAAMPERAGAALSAIVNARPGGVLFHCMGGRDRTGMIALLLLSAVNTKPEEIVADYLETIRLGDVRAISSRGRNVEPDIEALCKSQGTSTEGAFRSALASLNVGHILSAAGMSSIDRKAVLSWRGSIKTSEIVDSGPDAKD